MELCPESFRNALDSNSTIIISANCNVNYSGRAESYLPDGDRIIIIKADKTLLVHQPEGSNPINYMKENSDHKLLQKEGKLVLQSRNLLLKEYMDIVLNEIYSFDYHNLQDGQKLYLGGTEADMSDMIYDNPELVEQGFKPLSREERTKYGFIDVFGYDRNNTLVVIECKRYSADFSAVEQLKRYVEKIKQLKGLEKVRGILAAPKITPNAKHLLLDHGFEFRHIHPPKYLEKYDKQQKNLGEY